MQTGDVGLSLQAQGLDLGDAYSLVERQPFDLQVVVSGDFLRCDQVKAGLGFTRVGDGGGADFEVALGRGQLFRHGCLLRLDEAQAFLRRQDIKVGLAGAHHQFLRGRFELGQGQVDLLHPLCEGGQVGRTIQWVAAIDRQTAGAERTTAHGIGLVVQIGLRQIAP